MHHRTYCVKIWAYDIIHKTKVHTISQHGQNRTKPWPQSTYIHTYTHTHTHTHTTVLRLYGFCLGQPGWAGSRRNIHPLARIVVINRPLSASSNMIHGILPVQSTRLTVFFHNLSLQVFFGLPLGLAPSTSYSIHFFYVYIWDKKKKKKILRKR